MIRCLVVILLTITTMPISAQNHRQQFTLVTPKNFDSGGAVSRQFHLHAESYLRSATISRGEQVHRLPAKPRSDLADAIVTLGDTRLSFAEYVAQDALLDSVLILHRGVIVFEAYPHMQPRQRHYAWSVTKVLTSAVLATLVAEDLVDMDAAIDVYVAALKNTAWSGTSVRDIANMASGIDCLDSDGYQDTSTCVYRMEETLGITAPTGAPLDFLAHLRGMSRRGSPGAGNEYVSANTNVLMLLIENVTGESYADAVRTRIWERIGAESDGLMSISAEGYAYASGGLSAKLRDLARFGLVFTDKERFADVADSMIADIRAGGGIALPEDAQALLRQEYAADLPGRAAWQWDEIWDDGGMYKGGYLGQGLYVDPGRNLVIAWFGTGLDYSEQMTAMKSVARQLAVGFGSK